MDLSGSRIVTPVAAAPGPIAVAKPRAPRRKTPAGTAADNGTRPGGEAASFANAPDERHVASLASLMRLAEAYLPEDDVRRIREAYRLADQAHLGQFRSSGEPYISHPIAVCEICAGWKLDADSLMAALLH